MVATLTRNVDDYLGGHPKIVGVEMGVLVCGLLQA
jgi:hypothetical protein